MTIEKTILQEISIINGALADLGVNAGCAPGWTVVAGSSHIVYGVRLAPAVWAGGKIVRPAGRPDQVAKAAPLIAERISAARGKSCPVRLRELPLAIEVDHPLPAPIFWRRMLPVVRDLAPGSGLVGRSWDGAGGHAEVIDLDEQPHVLIAGTTKSGKSTVGIALLGSLCVSTPPADLHLYLIDLKNEDFVPLAKLPHVRGIAVDKESAIGMVYQVESIKNDRVAAGVVGSAPRVVLAIDELAQLSGEAGALAALGSVLSVGRSKRIHVIAATQKPTAEILSSQGRANFAVRLVGQVVDAQEGATATGRSEAGAQFLPGPGAFLRVEGAIMRRFQSYDLRAGGVDRLVDWASDNHPGAAVASVVTGNITSEKGVPAPLAEIFAAYADGGTLRRGWKSAAVRWLAGPDVSGGRLYAEAADRVDRYFDMWRGSYASAD